MSRTFVIAIDGPAASGKSTTARRVAAELGFIYVDSGAMYRAATLAVLNEHVDVDDESAVVSCVNHQDLTLRSGTGGTVIPLLNGQDVSREIRTGVVTAHVSRISSYRGVRDRMVELQRKLAESGQGIVMDGRDIGTAVFPDADLKIYMIADSRSRAARRQAELANMGEKGSVDDIERQLVERDRIDSTRIHSPLIRAFDAVVLDTSNLSIDQQVEEVVRLARKRMPLHR